MQGGPVQRQPGLRWRASHQGMDRANGITPGRCASGRHRRRQQRRAGELASQSGRKRAEDESLPEPNTFAALKHAIANDDFGVVLGDDGGKPLHHRSQPSRPTRRLARSLPQKLAAGPTARIPLESDPPKNLAAGQLPGFSWNLMQP
eukprot:7165085-Prymnesium_polylepis.1